MRTRLDIDDQLLKQARSMSGTQDDSALIREALAALIERESARRLAALGGSQPQLETLSRRRSRP
ncbi:MAG: type II toxin-antitoxin system VapB family antitoxin [Gammaproteobacteria bacterium]|jgi:Arc/MetJ family transcription regulator|nr:type II toxin-antitoxin system VapB family antitoxin [Gammaproteobacteria bacterium]